MRPGQADRPEERAGGDARPGGRDGAARVLSMAAWLLPPSRAEWGRAMWGDLASLTSASARRGFAWGCLRAAIWPGLTLRLLTYAAMVAAAFWFTAWAGIGGALKTEVIGLATLVPPGLFWFERAGTKLSVVSANRAARTARRLLLAVVALCVAVTSVTIGVTMPANGSGSGGAGATGGLLLVVVFLVAYTACGFSLTSAAAGLPPAGLTAVCWFGAGAGLAWCVLMPFNQPFASTGAWLSLGYAVALALVVVGAPAATAVVTARRSDRSGHPAAVGAGTAGLAALIILAGGWGMLRLCPGLLDSGLFDQGPLWRPPDIVEQVVPSYLWVLALAPALGALVGRLAAGLVRHPPILVKRAVLSLAAVGALVYPATYVSAAMHATTFRGVGLTGATFSAAGTTVLTGDRDATILWNVADPDAPVRLATFNSSVVYAPDGRHLASRNVLWSLADPSRLVRVVRFDGASPTAFTPDGRTLFTHDEWSTMAWSLADPAHPVRLSTIPNPDGQLSPDGRTLLTGGDGAPMTTVWDVSDPARPRVLSSFARQGWGVFSPDGRTFAVNTYTGGDHDHTIWLWNLADRRHPVRAGMLDATGVDRAAFTPDSAMLAVGDDDGSVVLWDLRTATRIATLPATPGSPNNAIQIGASSLLTTVGFADGGRTLSVVTGNSTVSVWDLADPVRPVRAQILTRHTDGAGRVVFSPDGTTLLGAAVNGTDSVTLWRLR